MDNRQGAISGGHGVIRAERSAERTLPGSNSRVHPGRANPVPASEWSVAKASTLRGSPLLALRTTVTQVLPTDEGEWITHLRWDAREVLNERHKIGTNQIVNRFA